MPFVKKSATATKKSEPFSFFVTGKLTIYLCGLDMMFFSMFVIDAWGVSPTSQGNCVFSNLC